MTAVKRQNVKEHEESRTRLCQEKLEWRWRKRGGLYLFISVFNLFPLGSSLTHLLFQQALTSFETRPHTPLLDCSWGSHEGFTLAYVKSLVFFFSFFFSLLPVWDVKACDKTSVTIYVHIYVHIFLLPVMLQEVERSGGKKKRGVGGGEPWRSMDCGNKTKVLLASLLSWKNSAAESKLPADTIKYRQQPACYTHAYTTAAANPQRLSQH